jgi:hypothetical protein
LKVLGAALTALFFCTGSAEARQACDQALGLRVCYGDVGGPVGYGHDILGDTPEWTELRGPDWVLRAPGGLFEDIAPRVADVTGDGLPEVVAVQTDLQRGARLIVVSANGKMLAATRYIGQPHRWMAQAGVGDFDGDGRVEIAYVDRPHLAKELVFLRLAGDELREVARMAGFSNHRIGDTQISGGARNCGRGDELVVASGDWSRVMAVRIGAAPRDIGAYSARRMKAALACQ